MVEVYQSAVRIQCTCFLHC